MGDSRCNKCSFLTKLGKLSNFHGSIRSIEDSFLHMTQTLSQLHNRQLLSPESYIWNNCLLLPLSSLPTCANGWPCSASSENIFPASIGSASTPPSPIDAEEANQISQLKVHTVRIWEYQSRVTFSVWNACFIFCYNTHKLIHKEIKWNECLMNIIICKSKQHFSQKTDKTFWRNYKLAGFYCKFMRKRNIYTIKFH